MIISRLIFRNETAFLFELFPVSYYHYNYRPDRVKGK